MKTKLFFLLFITSTFLSVVAQKKETVNLILEVSVTKHNKGSILIALYDHKENYMKKSYKNAEVKVENGKAIIEFTNLEKREYAFSLFHDINDNKKLDSNFLGIPKEPYAFSNNKKGSFGPPRFKDAKFHLTDNKTINISIK